MKTSRVRVAIDSLGLKPLQLLGIDISHGYYEKGKYFEGDFNSGELVLLEQATIQFEILIHDVSKFYIERNFDPNYIVNHAHAHAHTRSDQNCNIGQTKILGGPEPVNFELGSMIGFHRYNEILYHLDKMHELYPHLIRQIEPIGAFRTFKGRPIYHTVISNQPQQNQSEKPKILYTALHHAREPISVTQMLYFMWFVLENYDKDDLIKSIVDNYELYFVPIVNPDGYLFNEQTNPMGGGDQRKNIKTYDGQNIGIDLNRNYRFNWGMDTIGSSRNHSSETYRGPFAGSESETRAIMSLCELNTFDIAINNHSAGHALLHPWGFSVESVEDILTFRELGQEMIRDNKMYAGLVSNQKAIGYFTNGTSDDWMYGERDEKNKIFAFTPEIGHMTGDGFWPQMSRIRPLCKEMLHSNIVSAAMLGNYGLLLDSSPDYAHETNYKFNFNLKRLGLRGGDFKVTLEPLSDNILAVESEKIFSLQQFATQIGEMEIYLKSGIKDYEEIKFVIHLDNGLYVHRDTIIKLFLSNAREVFFDGALSLDNWATEAQSNWQVNDIDAYSFPFSFTNSISSTYNPSENSIMTLADRVDLTNARAAYLTFKTKYAIEPKYDKAILSASTTGFQFQPLCGRMSKFSEAQHSAGIPVYDGFQYDWAMEMIDLKDYLGTHVFLRVGFHADDKDQFEGFSFDDFRVVVVNEPAMSVDENSVAEIHFQLFPNPSSGQLFYRFMDHLSMRGEYQIRMYNAVGQVVHTERLYTSAQQSGLNIPKLHTGLYTYQLMSNSSVLSSGKFIMR